MKTLGFISLCAGLAAGGGLLPAATADSARDKSADPTVAPTTRPESSASATTRDHASASAGATKPDPTGTKSTSYPDKETYPHSGANSSPTALIAGANPSSGAPIAPSASVIADRIKEWKLGPTEIESEMKAGPIVRTKGIGANEPTGPADDEALHTLINNRLLADSDTVRVTTKDMQVKNGEVTFEEASSSSALLGRAIAVVLDTKGVSKVTAHATLDASLPGAPADDAKRIPDAPVKDQR